MSETKFCSSRWKAAGAHLLISAALVLMVGIVYRALGYTFLLANLQGALSIFALVVFVDLCLGPLVTLIVSSPNKTRAVLLRDWGVIAIVQLAALAYGSYAFIKVRPVVVAVANGRADIVTADVINNSNFDAQKKCLTESFLPNMGICVVIAVMPEDSKKRTEIALAALGGGRDITALTEYYLPARAASENLASHLVSIKKLKYLDPALGGAVDVELARHQGQDDLVALWIMGREKSAALIFRSIKNPKYVTTIISM